MLTCLPATRQPEGDFKLLRDPNRGTQRVPSTCEGKFKESLFPFSILSAVNGSTEPLGLKALLGRASGDPNRVY